MSDDLIKRSDAIEALCDISNKSDMPEDWHKGMSVAISALYRVPPADRPQGEWIDIGGYEVCKNCHEVKRFPHWNYCPNCGARMKGAEDDID